MNGVYRKSAAEGAYRYLRRLEHETRHVSGPSLALDRLLHPVHQTLIILLPLLHHEKQHYPLVLVRRPPLPHTYTVLYTIPKILVDNIVDLRRPETHTAWVQHAVGPAEEYDVLRHRVDHDEVAVHPAVIEPRKVAVVVALRAVRAPEHYRHIRERRVCNQLAWLTVGDLTTFDTGSAVHRLVVNFGGCAEGFALAAAGVEGEERVAGTEGAREIGTAGDVVELDEGREAGGVEPKKLGLREDHPCACDDAEGAQVGGLFRDESGGFEGLEVSG